MGFFRNRTRDRFPFAHCIRLQSSVIPSNLSTHRCFTVNCGAPFGERSRRQFTPCSKTVVVTPNRVPRPLFPVFRISKYYSLTGYDVSAVLAGRMRAHADFLYIAGKTKRNLFSTASVRRKDSTFFFTAGAPQIYSSPQHRYHHFFLFSLFLSFSLTLSLSLSLSLCCLVLRLGYRLAQALGQAGDPASCRGYGRAPNPILPSRPS